ncbi:LAFA_0C07668g1_1 [Lachancea sp. 'fantastica']|nr:LAFA_0C07668g1_1 [Lachancea sp. 'fantastica']
MTKLSCLADVCMVPLGTETASVSDFVAAVERKIRESHLKSTLHSAGTTIEGPWDEVTGLIGELHEYAHKLGYVRVHTDIRIGTRTDKAQTAAEKVDTVLEKLKSSRG